MTNRKNEFFPGLDISVFSDCGLIRQNNEDSVLSLPDDGCFVIADGMGGCSAGEEASRIVVDSIAKAVAGSGLLSPGERKLIVHQALLNANDSINRYRKLHCYNSMGSTAVILLLDSWNSQSAQVCYIGDSRLYCLRNGELFQITDDHNIKNEIKPQCKTSKDLMNALTRAIGIADVIRPEWRPLSLCSGDVLLLCSDGVTSMLTNELLLETISKAEQSSAIVSLIREEVMQKGAMDNFSMICMKITSQPLPKNVDPNDVIESDYLLANVAERSVSI